MHSFGHSGGDYDNKQIDKKSNDTTNFGFFDLGNHGSHTPSQPNQSSKTGNQFFFDLTQEKSKDLITNMPKNKQINDMTLVSGSHGKKDGKSSEDLFSINRPETSEKKPDPFNFIVF